MRSKWSLLAVVGILAMVATGLIIAQEKPATEAGAKIERKDDDTAIREAAQAFARAFEKGDAKAVGQFFTEEGEYRDDSGEVVNGRAGLEKAYAAFFAKRPELKAEVKTKSIRFLGKDTAVEEGTFTVRAKDSPPNIARYSSLFVRQDGRWLIAMLKEWGEDIGARAPKLEDLGWLIGTWEAETPESRVRTTYDWVANKKFIRCHFSIKNKKDDAESSAGTQVIGVDPASNLVRSWTFDSEGGIGESNWTHDGQRWVIESAGTLPDGSRTTAVNFLARSGDNGLSWRSVERTLDGEKQPDIGPVKAKRLQAEKSSGQ
jgi:uncharacterized protein (TIGR02246 family)